MMGKSHVIAGGLAGLGVGVAAVGLGHPAALLAVLGAGAGAGLVCDLDEPHSTVARAGGWATKGVSLLVRRLPGGHRGASHSLLGAIVLFGALWGVGTKWPDAIGVAAGLMAALCVRVAAGAVFLGRPTRWLLEIAGGVLVGHLALGAGALGVAGAIGAGVLSHVACDSCTDHGASAWWPLRRGRSGGSKLRTGSAGERWLRWAGLAGLVVASWAAFGPHASALGSELAHTVRSSWGHA